MLGPGYGLDNYTDGAMMAHFMLVLRFCLVGIMNLLLTIKHTREDEEDGRIEMDSLTTGGPLSPIVSDYSNGFYSQYPPVLCRRFWTVLLRL